MKVCIITRKNIYKVIFLTLMLVFFLAISGCNTFPEQPIEVENYPPNILSEPIQVAYIGEEYIYNIDAHDVEGDSMFYSLNIKPQGMEINSSTGMITWIPVLDQLGENQVEVKVSDNNLFETQSFKITVYKSDEEGDITQIFFDPSSQNVSLDFPVEIDIKIENVFHLKGASISLYFDANQLQYKSSIDKEFIPNAILLEQTIDNINGEVTLDIASLGINSYASGSGTLFMVSFETISSGNATLLFDSCELRDNENNQINHNVGSDCTIHIN
jgi:hypothetical protein